MYKVMTPGPTQVKENVRMARSLVCTNPDLDEDFVEFYKDTCELISSLLGTKNETLPAPPSLSREIRCSSLRTACTAKALRTLYPCTVVCRNFIMPTA